MRSVQRLRAALVAALIAVGVVLVAVPAGAHTPHDDISDVVFSPTYAQDGKVFVVSASRLLVSADDDYHWKPLVRGLPRAPEEGKSLFRVAIAPSSPATMYLTSRVGGVFRSADGGRSWQSAVGDLPNGDMAAVAVSPGASDTVLAAGATSGFYRTADAGEHWESLPATGGVSAVTFVPASGRAVAGDLTGQVRVSDDDGATWRVVSTGKAGVTAVAATGGDGPGTVFAGDSTGSLLRSDDGGETFAGIGRGLPTDQIASIAASPAYERDHTVWVSLAERGVYRSVDSGRSWVRASRGLTTDEQAHQVNVAEFRTIAASRGPDGIVLYEAGFDGLFRSDDGGRHWVPSQTLVDFVVGLDVSPSYARDRSVAAATYVKGAYLSNDAGSTWRTIDGGLQQNPGEGNKFATIRRLHNITFSPDYAHDRTIFSAGWTVFLKSTNRGRSWQLIHVTDPPQQVLRQFVLGVAPDYDRRHELYLGTRQGDVFRSARAGDPGSWELAGNVGARVRSFAFDPAGTTIFVGTAAGVSRSDDRGATWTPTGLQGEAMLAISPEYTTDRTVFAGTPDGLFVSRDEGGSWARAEVTQPARGIEALAVSPAYGADGTVLVSVTGDGLFKSTNGGRTFRPTGADLFASNHIVADFTNPSGTPIQFSPDYARDGTIFGYASQDVVRSTDGGETWKVLRLPSAESFARTVGHATSVDRASASGGISKRRLAVIVLVALVVIALVGLALRARRRRGDRRRSESATSSR